MPEDRQILMISGKDLDPVFAQKRAYFEQPDMAGQFMPNPMHPPANKVSVPGLIGKRWRNVITEEVPPHLAHYPQYKDGKISYIRGYRPF